MEICHWTDANDVCVYKNTKETYTVIFPDIVWHQDESVDFLERLDRRIPLEQEIAQTLIRRMDLVDTDYYPVEELRGGVYSFDYSSEVLIFLSDIETRYPKVKIDWNYILEELK